MDSDAENSRGGVGGRVRDKGARWATGDRVRKKMSVFHKFHGKKCNHSKEKQYPTAVLLIIKIPTTW